MTRSLERKACVDCRHAYFWFGDFGNGQWCQHKIMTAYIKTKNKEAERFSPVIGNYVQSDEKIYPDCSLARKTEDVCGASGKLWEKKIGFFSRILGTPT